MGMGNARRSGGALVLVIVLLAATLAACGGGGDKDEPSTPTAVGPAPGTMNPAATPTGSAPEPTNTLVPLATETPTPAPTSTPDPSVVAALQGAALTLADMPAGWVELPADPSGSETGPCGNPDFERKNNKLGEIEVQFQADELGPFVLQNLVVFPEADAADAMAWSRDAIDCTEWTETDANGAPVTYRIAPLEVDAVGDESFAVRVEVDIQDVGTLMTDTVFIRVGTVLSIVGYSSIDAPDLERLSELATTAAQRMAQVELP